VVEVVLKFLERRTTMEEKKQGSSWWKWTWPSPFVVAMGAFMLTRPHYQPPSYYPGYTTGYGAGSAPGYKVDQLGRHRFENPLLDRPQPAWTPPPPAAAPEEPQPDWAPPPPTAAPPVRRRPAPPTAAPPLEP
jgi:hypothetical protein